MSRFTTSRIYVTMQYEKEKTYAHQYKMFGRRSLPCVYS